MSWFPDRGPIPYPSPASWAMHMYIHMIHVYMCTYMYIYISKRTHVSELAHVLGTSRTNFMILLFAPHPRPHPLPRAHSRKQFVNLGITPLRPPCDSVQFPSIHGLVYFFKLIIRIWMIMDFQSVLRTSGDML